MPSVVTITTDFGSKDPYVAEMKAVILRISPNTTIVDITHEIEKFNVRMAAYTLACAAPYFPDGTIHVAVIDPHVGTERRALVIKTRNAFYVGPDNGVLALAATNEGIKHVFKITNRRFMLLRISNTFHGRDIFAPVAAHLANETKPREFGPEIRRISTPEFARVARKKNALIGEVLHVDGFGNIITNFKRGQLDSIGIKGAVAIGTKNRNVTLRLCKAYAEVKKKEPLAVFGSQNFLEISVNQGNAAAIFKVKDGDKITLLRPKP
jgi:S-adenosylmethionine hydrolase